MKSALLLVLAGACQQQARTELVLGVATDLAAPGILDSVELQVASTSNGVAQVDKRWDITGTANLPENLPGSFGIEADDASTTLDIVLKGFKDGKEVVRRHALLGLVDGRTLFYRIGLTAGCIGRNDCPTTAGMTCVEGSCRPLKIDPLTLPDYDDDSVTRVSCQSFAQFIDTTTGRPMPATVDAASCPPDQCVEGTCLEPPPGGTRDVTVIALDPNVVHGMVTYVPESNTVVEAILPDGTTIAGTDHHDGTFKLASVPVGAYVLHVDHFFYATTASVFDLGEVSFDRGRPTPDLAMPATITVPAGDELDPWVSAEPNDGLHAGSMGAGDYWLNLQHNLSLTDNTTTFTNLTFTARDASNYESLVTNDDFVLYQLHHTTTAGVDYLATTKILDVTPFTQMNGGTTTINDAHFTPITRDHRVNAEFPGPAWEAAVGAHGSTATRLGPGAQRIAGQFPHTELQIRQQREGMSYGTTGGSYDLMQVESKPMQTLVLADVSFGTIPTSNEELGIAYNLDDEWTVPLQVPGTTQGLGFTAGIYVSGSLAALPGSLKPVLGPVLAPTIDGLDAFQAQSGVGMQPMLAWTAPDVGHASDFEILLYALTSASGMTAASAVAELHTTGNSIQIPAGVLVAGMSYTAIVIARNPPNAAAPYRIAFPSARSRVVTNRFTP